ncbi:MAG: hypothetical protein PUJ48_08300 [Subdoligranulum variabile]|jgi:hypothetical protein|uniref:hypothetical protein n=1 Tax=Gemmiger sp. TaxID=2049027 RepID=UPI002A912251|nr:hypothetical protein [Gemmiger sp.]MDD7640179.1 hypothetical protein [Subdoligranulum variabile]MDY5606047.1 hypothetical protein [Gemmiger sp.]
MFGHSKKKAAAEMMAPQWMKILVESRDIVNRTTEPDVFFSRYDTVKEKAEQLASISKYVKFKGMKPAEVLRRVTEQEDAATRDMVLRCFQKAVLNAEKLKTEKGKLGQFEKFQSSLEPYFFRMSDENARLVQDLHDEALKKIGG